jgi:hypothetical protein
MARRGVLAMAAALATTAASASEVDYCSPAAIQTALSGKCPAHAQQCSGACKGYITTMLGSCPHFKHALHADDLGFITKRCGLSLDGSAGKGFYDLSAVDIEGNTVHLNRFHGKVSLVVNVAQF